MSAKPLVVDLYAGRLGWSKGFLAAGYRSVAFDLERPNCEIPPDVDYVLQDVLTLHGSQFRNAAVIVGSSPCQEFSYRAMPWKRAKALPPPVKGIELFEAQFRIQREASEAAGRYIPLVCENVVGAQKWVGKAKAHFGSYYLWGDIASVGEAIVATKPVFGQALRVRRVLKQPGRNFHFLEKYGIPPPSFHGADHEESVQRAMAIKNSGGSWFGVAHNTDSGVGKNPVNGIKGTGGSWFTPDPDGRAKQGHWRDGGCVTRCYNSKDPRRKQASALIAEIPFDLAYWLAQVFLPR